MPPGLQLAGRLPRRRRLHLRHGRGERHPGRASRVRRLAGRDVRTRPTGRAPAAPRILRILDRQQVRATFFVPGYTAERWPDAVRAVRDAGHEIGHHGYLHEGAHSAPDEATEERRLLRGLEALDAVLGVRPVGYRAPMWELSVPAARAAARARIPVRLRPDGCGPSLSAGDRRRDRCPSSSCRRHWSLDDWEPYNYLPGITGSGLIASPADVLARWTLELEALVEDGGLFMLTNHPFISGRASRAAALETLIARAKEIDGLWIATAAGGRPARGGAATDAGGPSAAPGGACLDGGEPRRLLPPRPSAARRDGLRRAAARCAPRASR